MADEGVRRPEQSQSGVSIEASRDRAGRGSSGHESRQQIPPPALAVSRIAAFLAVDFQDERFRPDRQCACDLEKRANVAAAILDVMEDGCGTGRASQPLPSLEHLAFTRGDVERFGGGGGGGPPPPPPPPPPPTLGRVPLPIPDDGNDRSRRSVRFGGRAARNRPIVRDRGAAGRGSRARFSAPMGFRPHRRVHRVLPRFMIPRASRRATPLPGTRRSASTPSCAIRPARPASLSTSSLHPSSAASPAG